MKLSRDPEIIKVMTPFPHHVEYDASLGEALAMMDEHNIRHVPVVDASTNELKGIVSKNRINFALGIHREDQAQQGLLVSDVCQAAPLVVDISTSTTEVIQEMKERYLEACLVTRKNKLAGIFTSSDVFSLLLAFLEDASLEPPDIIA